MKPILVDTKTLEELLMVSKNTAVKIGDAAGARVMIGTALRWKVSAIETYINNLGGSSNEEREICV